MPEDALATREARFYAQRWSAARSRMLRRGATRCETCGALLVEAEPQEQAPEQEQDDDGR